MNIDKATHEAKFILRKYKSEAKEELLEETIFEDNAFLNEGIGAIWDAITGLGSPTTFNESNSYIGVGDGTTAEDASQTGLQGSNKSYQPVDAGYPSRSGTTVTWRATFGGTEANFTWNEFTVANGNSDTAVNINRKQSNQGTKSSGATWELEVQLTIA